MNSVHGKTVLIVNRIYNMSPELGSIFITGLSGSGKSTLARVLLIKFLEMRTRPVTLLDGDIVRKNLSSELNFSREHRALNITRIGFVASEITKNGGICLCAPIAPYEESRQANRSLSISMLWLSQTESIARKREKLENFGIFCYERRLFKKERT